MPRPMPELEPVMIAVLRAFVSGMSRSLLMFDAIIIKRQGVGK